MTSWWIVNDVYPVWCILWFDDFVTVCYTTFELNGWEGITKTVCTLEIPCGMEHDRILLIPCQCTESSYNSCMHSTVSLLLQILIPDVPLNQELQAVLVRFIACNTYTMFLLDLIQLTWYTNKQVWSKISSSGRFYLAQWAEARFPLSQHRAHTTEMIAHLEISEW